MKRPLTDTCIVPARRRSNENAFKSRRPGRCTSDGIWKYRKGTVFAFRNRPGHTRPASASLNWQNLNLLARILEISVQCVLFPGPVVVVVVVVSQALQSVLPLSNCPLGPVVVVSVVVVCWPLLSLFALSLVFPEFPCVVVSSVELLLSCPFFKPSAKTGPDVSANAVKATINIERFIIVPPS